MRKRVALALLAMCLLAPALPAATVSPETARRACEVFLSRTVELRGPWAGSLEPTIRRVHTIRTGDTLLAYRFDIEPAGYVLVNACTELAPIAAFNDHGGGHGDAGYRTILDIVTARHRQMYQAVAESRIVGASTAWSEMETLFSSIFPHKPEGGGGHLEPPVPPLITTKWQQGYPYNARCPVGDGRRCYVGCNGVALAQLLRYWEWPPYGNGTYSYWWDGDQSCDGSTPGISVVVDLTEGYDWDHMPDEVVWSSPQDQIDAVSRLCFDAAAAINTDFGACGSGTQFSRCLGGLVDRFFYRGDALYLWRFRYDTEDWYNLIAADVEAGRPVLYSTAIHTFLVDGCFVVQGNYLVHANFGWGGEMDGWFGLDGIYTTINPLAEQAIFGIEPDPDAFAAAFKAGAGQAGGTGRIGEDGGHRLAVAPNPANPRTVLRFHLPADGPVTLDVYDLAGRLVRRLVDGSLAAGDHVVSWNGTDDAGRPAASGTYRVLLRTPDGLQRGVVSLTR